MTEQGKGVPVDVHESLLADNDRIAQLNRDDFRATGVTCVNLLGAPGCGKTSVLEATRRHRPDLTMAALVGDMLTSRDTRRLEAVQIRAAGLTRECACHLEARMLRQALPGFLTEDLDVLFVENVGNLVCPALYDLGQNANVVALAVTQGADQPLKYPQLFRRADLVLLTKVDLLPHLHVMEVVDVWDSLRATMPLPRLVMFSAQSGQGVDDWLDWLEGLRTGGKASPRRGSPTAKEA